MNKNILIHSNDIKGYGIITGVVMTVCSFVIPQKTIAQTDSLSNIKINTDFQKEFSYNKKQGELKLNEEAIKLIKFDFMSSGENDNLKPMEAQMEKPWMNFKQDFAVPINLTDTTKVRKPGGYIRMLPYSIWTKFGEDPVYDVMVFGKKKEYKISWTLNPFRDFDDNYGLSIAPSAGIISDGLRMRGAGIAIGNLDIIGFLYNNLSRHGRMIQHNKKHANAWKTYIGYQPTLSDSLKFPTFYNGLTGPIFIYNPKDSMHIATGNPEYEEIPDSISEEIKAIISTKRDSLRKEYLKNENEKADNDRKAKRIKRSSSRAVKEARKARIEKEKSAIRKEEEMRENLPDKMEDLYKYMREKVAKEIEEREKKRKEKEFEID